MRKNAQVSLAEGCAAMAVPVMRGGQVEKGKAENHSGPKISTHQTEPAYKVTKSRSAGVKSIAGDSRTSWQALKERRT